VSRAQLEDRLARQFPYKSRFLELLDVTVSTPRLTLLPDLNRIGTELDVSTGERLSGRTWQGSLRLNYRLRFDPADNTVRLIDVRVERFQIDAVPAAWQTQVDRIGSLLSEQLLRDQPVHTLKPENVQMLQSTGLVPGELIVTTNGISIPLKPAR
jgi:hypothetical protein